MTTDPITLTVTDSVAPADDAAVIRGLTLFNEEQHGRPHDRRPIAVIARDAGGAVVGGLTGYTQWDWLYVDHLWAGEDRRRSGLGTRLMEAAEAEARARGCRWSRLYTYDFQAPGFYLKRGYRVWAEMEGYPPGHKQIWFRKDLD